MPPPITKDGKKGKKDKELRKLPTKNLSYLTYINVILGMSALLPLLCIVHSLTEFAQGQGLFVCNYVAAISCCIEGVQSLYTEESSSFSQEIFWDFNALLETRHDHVPLSLIASEAIDLNSEHGVETLHFTPASHKISAIYIALDGSVYPVTWNMYRRFAKR